MIMIKLGKKKGRKNPESRGPEVVTVGGDSSDDDSTSQISALSSNGALSTQ